MMYPNPNFLTYFPDAELPEDQGRDTRSSCLRIGTWIVIEKLMMEGLDEPGVIFSYTSYIRMLEANLPTLLDFFYSNIGYVG